MKFPKFSEFLATIDEDTYRKLISNAQSINRTIEGDMVDVYTFGMPRAAASNTLILLELYHEWLERNFSSK